MPVLTFDEFVYRSAVMRIARLVAEYPEAASGMAVLDIVPGECDRHGPLCWRLWIAGVTPESHAISRQAPVELRAMMMPDVVTEHRTVKINRPVLDTMRYHAIVHFNAASGQLYERVTFGPLEDAHREHLVAEALAAEAEQLAQQQKRSKPR